MCWKILGPTKNWFKKLLIIWSDFGKWIGPRNFPTPTRFSTTSTLYLIFHILNCPTVLYWIKSSNVIAIKSSIKCTSSYVKIKQFHAIRNYDPVQYLEEYHFKNDRISVCMSKSAISNMLNGISKDAKSLSQTKLLD